MYIWRSHWSYNYALSDLGHLVFFSIITCFLNFFCCFLFYFWGRKSWVLVGLSVWQSSMFVWEGLSCTVMTELQPGVVFKKINEEVSNDVLQQLQWKLSYPVCWERISYRSRTWHNISQVGEPMGLPSKGVEVLEEWRTLCACVCAFEAGSVSTYVYTSNSYLGISF